MSGRTRKGRQIIREESREEKTEENEESEVVDGADEINEMPESTSHTRLKPRVTRANLITFALQLNFSGGKDEDVVMFVKELECLIGGTSAEDESANVLAIFLKGAALQ